jgi:hypothetical protein
MRTFIFALSVLLTASAQAASLPILGRYGTGDSCAGTHSVDWLVSRDGIASLDFSCKPTKIRGAHAQLTCFIEGNTYSVSATVTENRQAGTLAYTDKNGTVTLRRCR